MICMASTFPKVKIHAFWKTTSVSKEEVVYICVHSHRITQNKYYEVKAKLMDFNCTVVETSESINDNDSELNAITYTFPKGAFLWGDLDQDQWSKICLDHGASKELMNPFWSWIHRFLWCTMIQTNLGSLILIQITPKECSLNKELKRVKHYRKIVQKWSI